MTKKIDLDYPSLLSYSGSITPSLFYFYNMNKEDEEYSLQVIKNPSEYKDFFQKIYPLQSYPSLLSTTKTFYIADKHKEDKLEKTNGANIQKTEKCHLPSNSDTLVIIGNIRFVNNAFTPNSINNKTFEQKCKNYFEAYKKQINFNLLATRYCFNLINEKLLWENKFGDTEILLKIKNDFYVFTGNDLSMIKSYNMNTFNITSIINNNLKNKIQNIINAIENVFMKSQPLFIELIYKTNIGMGQQVYPSQEFDPKYKRLAKHSLIHNGEKISQVIFSDQKIGNGIRTIDTWYDDIENISPIAIEPYGINQNNRMIYRNKNNSFYDYFMNLEHYIECLENNRYKKEMHIHHYIMACLIKGGIFGANKDNK